MTPIISKRLLAIDFLKGISILIMVMLHLLFILAEDTIIDSSIIYGMPYILVSRCVAVMFIALSTLVLWNRANNSSSAKQWSVMLARQVIKLGLAAMLVSVSTYWWLDQLYVRFGILHLLAVTTVVNGFLFRFRLPGWWYGLFGVLVLLLGNWLLLFTIPTAGWAWLGLVSRDFVSVDYVPIFPWLGITWLVAAVAPLSIHLCKRSQSFFESHQSFIWIFWCGRHSLAIYLLHVPLLLVGMLFVQFFL